jgi:hypothetical protein
LPLLLSVLSDTLCYFDRVFIMIDAIDESLRRENVLQLLHILVTDYRFGKIQLLATSRDYIDIRRTMSGISQTLSLSNPLVESDIKHYISAKIMSNTKFRRWPNSLRTEVEVKLSIGAKGMFRWAVCQLDILRRLDHPDKIRGAINDLPETLDETYERIFSYIPREDRELVRHALRWICFHNILWKTDLPLAASILLDAYFINATETHVENRQLFDIEVLKESCGCLLTFAPDKDLISERVILAHYTVREFLESDRLKCHSSFFKLLPDDKYKDCLNAVFQNALGSETSGDFENMFIVRRMGLSEYCLASSFRSLNVLEEFVDANLVFQLLDPEASHYPKLRAAWTERHDVDEDEGMVLTDTVMAGAEEDSGKYFSQLKWDSFNSTDVAPAIFVLLVLLMELQCYHLAELCLRRYSVKAVLEAKFSVTLERLSSFSDEIGVWNFSGTVLEYFATYTSSTTYPFDKDFRFCCNHGAGIVDFTSILSFYLPIHNHFQCQGNVEEDCVLKTLLHHGAHMEPKGYEIAPLQICCARLDVPGVKLLLEAGADPNFIGQKNGIVWGSDSMLYEFKILLGMSPLHIIRMNGEFEAIDTALTEKDLREGSVSSIESLLLEHGAQDFIVDFEDVEDTNRS